MSRTLICTTGTSIARDVPPLRAGADPEAYREQIRERLAGLRSAQPSRYVELLSAETKSLAALKADAADAVHLLHTDTVDGAICAEELARVMQAEMGIGVSLHRIKGLQVLDAAVFRKDGVDALFAALKRLTADASQAGLNDQVVLNATGGFKSVVPFITLFGLLHRFDVVYMFEFSNQLIRLPAVPVQFDFAKAERADAAIRKLREEGVMAEEDFYALIPDLDFHDRKSFESFLEVDGGQVTLSALAEQLFFAKAEERFDVKLSPSSQAALAESSGLVREQFEFMLSRVTDRLWRDQKRHAFAKTELDVFKPGNTAQRLAGYVEGTSVYVCELYGSHDRYEHHLSGRRRADYPKSQFTDWTPSAPQAVMAESDDQWLELLEARLAGAQAGEAAAQAGQLALMQELEAVTEKGKAERGAHESHTRALSTENAALHRQLAQAQAELQAERQAAIAKPWWKRLLGL